MNMISTGAFLSEMDASNKQPTLAEKFAAVWEKKNAKAARAGGVSLMALSLAACGSSSDSDTDTSGTGSTGSDVDTTPVSSALTTGLDTVTGGAGNDSFSGSNTTLNAGDSITGGAGTDTLAIFSSAVATIGGFTATGVETISVSSTDTTAANVVTVNMGSVSGETGLQVTGSSSSATFTNTDNIAPLTLSYNSDGNVIVAYNASTVSGTADAMTVNTTDTTNDTVTLAGIETLTVNNSGTSTVSTLTTTAATSMNVTGDGTLTLTNIDDATKTVDMSGFTGTSTVGGFGAVDLTVTGGSGANTMVVDLGNIDSSDTITGGDGSDTLRIATDMTSSANMAGVSGFETVELRTTDDGGTDTAVDLTVDASIIGGTTAIRVADSAGGADNQYVNVAVTNAASTQTVTATDSTETEYNDTNDGVAITVTQKAGVGSSSDVLNLNINGETLLSATANEYETLNIATGGSAASTITSLAATTAQNIVITGTQNLTLTAIDMEEQSTTKTSNIDASGLTGKLTLTTSNDEGDQIIKGGSANDSITITGLDADDSIVGNGGIDTLSVADVNGDHGEVNVDVERMVITSDGTVVDTAVVMDVRNVTGLQRFTVDLNDGTSAIDENITINNIASGATVYVLDDFAANTDVLTIDGASDNKNQTIIFNVSSGASDDFNADLTANFDSLTLTTGAAAVDITVDAFSAATLDNLTLTGAGDITITSATNTTSLDVLSAGSMTGAVTLSSLARASSAEITLGAGNDSINFVTTSHAGNTISAGSGSDTLVITGASTSNLVIDLSSATDQLTNVSGAANTAAQTGFENITATNLTGAGINVTGSSSGNTIIGSAQADTISTGAGTDSVTGNGGNDIITAGDGVDTIVLTATAANASLGGLDTITGFTAGTGGDKLDISDFIGAAFTTGNFDEHTDATGDGSTTDLHVERVEYSGNINGVDFGSAGASGFDLLYGTAVYLANDDISGKAIIAVQGNDETHIYTQVDGGAAVDADDVTLIAILSDVTNSTDLVATNFV